LSATTVTVLVPGVLRQFCAGEKAVELGVDEHATVASVLDRLAAAHPALGSRVCDEQGRVRPHVNVFVGADNVRDLDGLETEVAPGAEVTILPAVSGGAAQEDGASTIVRRPAGTLTLTS
jgi:sulfur-carrier protein